MPSFQYPAHGFQDRQRMITLKGCDLRRACPIGHLTPKIIPGISREMGNLRLTRRSQALWSCQHRGQQRDTCVPDPAEVLRRQATVLRAGGLVVPIEIDFTTARALPASPLVNQAVAWLTETFAKSGIPAIGPRLWAIVQEAALRPIGMIGIQPHFGPEDPAAVCLMAGVIRTARP